MGIKSYKPYTPSRRTAKVSTFEEITKDKPERGLTKATKRKAGRDSAGRIAVRHRGGGSGWPSIRGPSQASPRRRSPRRAR